MSMFSEALSDEERAKLKYVRLYETYQTLQATHLQVIDLLSSTTTALHAAREEAAFQKARGDAFADEIVRLSEVIATTTGGGG